MRAHELLPPKLRRSRQAVRWHIGTTATVSIMGTTCICIKADKNGYIFQSVANPNHTIALTIEEFDLLKDGYEFELDPEGMKPAKAAAILKTDKDMLSNLSKQEKEKVEFKLKAIRMFLAMEARGELSRYRKNLRPVLKQMQINLNAKAEQGSRGGQTIKTFKLVGPKRFIDWVKLYLELGPLGLVNEYHKCGSHTDYYTREERGKILEYVYIYLSPERPTVMMLWRDMEEEIKRLNLVRPQKGLVQLRCPDYDLLRAEIRRLPPFDVVAARWSLEKAMRFFHPSKGGVPDLVRPMQRIEADDWDVHLHTLLMEANLWDCISPEMQAKAEKVRCVLSAAICGTTRIIPAITLALNTGASNTLMLLRMCLSDKSALAQAVGCETPWEYRALMDTFVVDEGSALLNFRTEAACVDLGIGFKAPQIATPQQRPKIERWFQTLEIRSLLRFSGRAFSNPVVRGKYEAAARACVTVQELAALIVRFVVDEYHNLPHAGLGGETPRQCWLRLTKKHAPTATPGPSRIRRAFGQDFTVVLQAEGIEIFGNWYRSPLTDNLFQTRIDREYIVRVDSEDLGAISLRHDNAWHTVLGPDVMKGVTVAVWEAALGDLRRQNQDLQDLVKPVVHRAINFAKKADAATRQRLSILYRPKTPEELVVLRARMNRTTSHREEILFAQTEPVNILSGALPAGSKAPKLLSAQHVADQNPGPTAKTVRSTKGKTRHPVKTQQPTPPTLARERPPARQWKPKERK